MSKNDNLPELTTEQARSLVMLHMRDCGAFNDTVLPPRDRTIFMEQPFSEWPVHLQQRLSPYGAHLIV